MRLTAFPVGDTEGWTLLPAPSKREWMTATPDGFAYRCLPMTMANHAGWIISCPVSFLAEWTGEEDPHTSLSLRFEETGNRYRSQIRSHFGSGIITFAIPYLFQTDRGTGLLVRGVPNRTKVNCTALEGYVETDWSPFTFTMNWKIHEAKIPVIFGKGEPICFIQPFRPELLEDIEPELRPLESEPELADAYRNWHKSRENFNANPAKGKDWQKDYHKGIGSAGKSAEHRTGFQVKEFVVKTVKKEG
jgi:hypothetical protein